MFVSPVSATSHSNSIYALLITDPFGILRLRKRIPTTWSSPPSLINSRSVLIISVAPVLIYSSASSSLAEILKLSTFNTEYSGNEFDIFEIKSVSQPVL